LKEKKSNGLKKQRDDGTEQTDNPLLIGNYAMLLHILLLAAI
jgi:hypothetical protein